MSSAQQQQQPTASNQISSGRLGERVIITTTTSSGDGMRYTLTRPFFGGGSVDTECRNAAASAEEKSKSCKASSDGSSSKKKKTNKLYISAKPHQKSSSASTVVVKSLTTGCYAHVLGDKTVPTKQLEQKTSSDGTSGANTKAKTRSKWGWGHSGKDTSNATKKSDNTDNLSTKNTIDTSTSPNKDISVCAVSYPSTTCRVASILTTYSAANLPSCSNYDITTSTTSTTSSSSSDTSVDNNIRFDQTKRIRQRNFSDVSLRSMKNATSVGDIPLSSSRKSPPLSALPLCNEIAAFFASDTIQSASTDNVKKSIHVTSNGKNAAVVTSTAVACADAPPYEPYVASRSFSDAEFRITDSSRSASTFHLNSAPSSSKPCNARVRLRRRQTNPDSDLGIEYGPRPSISSRGDAPSYHQHHHQQQPTLNRSYPCVYDGSQFTAIRSASFADGAFPDQDMDIPSSVTQTRSTAVVGPHTVADQRTAQTTGISNGDVHFRGMSRSFHENGNVFGVTASKRNPSPVGRRASTDIPPPTYTAHRRSVQPSDGIGLYQLCRSRSPSRSVYADLSQQLESIPIQTTKPSTVQSQAPQAPSTMFSSSTPQSSRPMRPRDIRIMSASPIPKSPTDHHLSSSSKHTSSNRRTVSSGVNAQLTSAMTIDDVPQMTSTPTSKKMMVAPQPHYRSHHKERNDDSCRVNSIDHSMVQRRQSAGAIVPTFASTQYQDSRRSYCRDNPLMVGPSGDQVFYVDDRTPRSKSGGDDIRVAVLEQRVRELETAMIGGMQSPSTSAASASFMIPVVGTKGGRMLTQSSGQLLVTPSGLSSTQQLMAKEIVDKEVEIERLQSQLRKCYSRMELRQVQYDEEVNAFRRESDEAKAQLARVKSRLNELENECSVYREKASAVEAARTSTMTSSLEKIASQEKEIATLRAELEKMSQLTTQIEKAKEELEFLELQNDALSTAIDAKDNTIRELEDSFITMKADTSGKTQQKSGSVTPRGDGVSLFGAQTSYFNRDLSDLKQINDTSKIGVSLTDLPLGVPKSRSTNQIGVNAASSAISDQEQLPARTSQMIRKQLAAVLECRLLAKCLKDIASKAISGDAPSVNRLLGCKSDSMSESEPEPLVIDPNPMTLNSAERYLKKGAEDMVRLEKDLNALREKFVEYYQKKVADELREDEACKIQ